MTDMKKRTPVRTFLSYIDLSREYYAAHGYTKPYKWLSHQEVPFARLEKPLSECRVGLLTTADLEKPSGDNKMERQCNRNVYAHPVAEVPGQFYTLDLQWDQDTTHTDDVDSFMPLNRLAECAAAGIIASASPRFYGVPTAYSSRRTITRDAPKVLGWMQEDDVDLALLIPL